MKHTIIVLFLTLTIFSACEKEGPQGPAGEDGNANVYSESFTVFSNAWEITEFDTYSMLGYVPQIEQLTPGIINNGAVLVYIKSEGVYIPMPWTIASEDIVAEYYYTFSDRFPGELAIIIESNVLVTWNPQTIDFRVVLIEGSISKQVDIKNIDEVSNYYNLTW